ncbi:MAG: polysaccharide deacetylase family protein [Flavobacteriaceae bacterium]|nr:polysaccharide deacetylase family protein [Flavobacteriaceae bacterium]
MSFVKTPKFISALFSGYIWHFSRQKKELYLTFDDGPEPKITPWVLETLKAFDAKATFFCVGENVKKQPVLFKRIISEGHQIGNHTFNHLNGLKTTVKNYLKSSNDTHNVFLKLNKGILLENNLLFRPPYGKIRPKQAKNLRAKGYKIILWDVLSRDFDTKTSKEDCFNNVIKNTKNGSIIVFHDSLKAFERLEDTLPKILNYFTEKGYSFKVIKDIALPN